MNALKPILEAHKKYVSDHPVVPEAPKASEVKQPAKSLDLMIDELGIGDEPKPSSVEKIGASQPPKPTQSSQIKVKDTADQGPKTGIATPAAQAPPSKLKEFMASQPQKPTAAPKPTIPTAPTYVAKPTVPETKVPKAPEAPVAPTAPTYVAKPTAPEAPVAPTAPEVKPITPTPTIPASKPTEAPVAPTAPEVKPTKAPEALQVKDKDDVPIVELTPVPAAEESKTAELAYVKEDILYLRASVFDSQGLGAYWLFKSKQDGKFYRITDLIEKPLETKEDHLKPEVRTLYVEMQKVVDECGKAVREYEDTIDNLTQELDKSSSGTIKSLEERIGSEVQAKESAQGALRALELEKKKLETDIKTYETTITKLNEQKVDASKYEQQLTEMKNQNAQYESIIANLKTIANDASTAATAWEGQYSSILKEKESLGQAAQAMKEAMLKANSNARETVANYQVLKQKCLEVMQQNADLQAKLESKQ